MKFEEKNLKVGIGREFTGQTNLIFQACLAPRRLYGTP